MQRTWQGVSDEICHRLPENNYWSRMSVILTEMQAMEDEMEENQVSKPDPLDDRVDAAEKLYVGN